MAPRGFDDYEVRLGDLMRGERATLGKSLLDVQRELKIKAAYIAAIENADCTAFETPGFIAGYVRSYARYLGMDPDGAYRAFCREAGLARDLGMSAGAGKPPQRPAAEPATSGPVDPFQTKTPFLPKSRPVFSGIEPGALGSIAVLAVLLGAIGYGGVAVFREVQKVSFAPVDQAPTVLAEVDPLDSAFDVAGADADALSPTAEALDRLYRPKALDVPVLTPRDGPIAALDPRTLGTYAPQPGAERFAAASMDPRPFAEATRREADLKLSIDSALATALDEGGGEPVSPVVTVAQDAPEVMLFAVQPTWIRVRAADGTVMFEKILDAGEQYVLPDTEGTPTLRAGNAGSLYFAVNGQTYGPAGKGPSVVKNVPLAAEALGGRYALADPEADVDLARYYASVEAGESPAD